MRFYLLGVFLITFSASFRAAEECEGLYNQWGNPYPHFEISDLSLYSPEQRQKMSIAAIQCGTLTSFSPNSPS